MNEVARLVAALLQWLGLLALAGVGIAWGLRAEHKRQGVSDAETGSGPGSESAVSSVRGPDDGRGVSVSVLRGPGADA
jgi:hypothetical protein